MRVPRLSHLSILAVALTATQAAAQNRPIFFELPVTITPEEMDTRGQIITGRYTDQSTAADNAYWTASEGVVQLGGTGSGETVVSGDGRVIAGSVWYPDEQTSLGSIWLSGMEWQPLEPFLPGVGGCIDDGSRVFGASTDGSIVSGTVLFGCDAAVFRWTAGEGAVVLPVPPPATGANAVDVSADGLVVVGRDHGAGPFHGVRWVGNLAQVIEDDQGNAVGIAYATNGDGSMVAGEGCTDGNAWTWTEDDGVVCLPGMRTARAMSDDGSVIGGIAGVTPNQSAVLSTSGAAPFDVRSWLIAEGYPELAGWHSLATVTVISGDGTVIAGRGHKDLPSPIDPRPFVIVIALASPELTVGKRPNGTELRWSLVTGAQEHDVVQGSLSGLLSSAGDFTTALEGCLTDDTASRQLLDDTTPRAGDGLWYLVRSEATQHVGSFDTGNPGQAGSRDSEIDAALAACGP